MTKPPSIKRVDRTLQIVPQGYWTFWIVIMLLSGIAGFVRALQERAIIWGVVSLAYGVAWAVVYWRIKHAK